MILQDSREKDVIIGDDPRDWPYPLASELSQVAVSFQWQSSRLLHNSVIEDKFPGEILNKIRLTASRIPSNFWVFGTVHPQECERIIIDNAVLGLSHVTFRNSCMVHSSTQA